MWVQQDEPFPAKMAIVYTEDDPYLRQIREAWAENLRLAFEQLPPISLPESRVRLVDP